MRQRFERGQKIEMKQKFRIGWISGLSFFGGLEGSRPLLVDHRGFGAKVG